MMPVTTHNLFTLESHDAPVCILCRDCGNRGIADKTTLESIGGVTNGSMTPLWDYKYKCSKCGGRRVDLYLTHPDRIGAWLRGRGKPEGV